MNPELIREWKVISYNRTTKDYILLSEDDERKERIITCLHCSTRLKIGKKYKGHKDVKHRRLIVKKKCT